MRRASLASLRAYRARFADNDGRYPISLFILGPSGCGKTTMEELAGMFDAVKRGYENPIVENAVRRVSQTSNLLTISLLKQLPPQLYPMFRETYLHDLAQRVGSRKVFTNTLSTCIHDAAHIASVLPNVRFIFLKRNMEDNLLRIFMRNYTSGNPYASDLKAAREHVLWFNEMIDLLAEKFSNIARVIRYEDMVGDPSWRTTRHSGFMRTCDARKTAGCQRGCRLLGTISRAHYKGTRRLNAQSQARLLKIVRTTMSATGIHVNFALYGSSQ